jgi:hypothetical protein
LDAAEDREDKSSHCGCVDCTEWQATIGVWRVGRSQIIETSLEARGKGRQELLYFRVFLVCRLVRVGTSVRESATLVGWQSWTNSVQWEWRGWKGGLSAGTNEGLVPDRETRTTGLQE